jgi:hypothetical protein
MDNHPGQGNATPFRVFWRGRWYRHEYEVRWHYLFDDELNLSPEYEPMGFKLSTGGYRPDFYLGALDAWAEIKGGSPNVEALDKADALARETGKAVVIFSGPPSAKPTCWVFCKVDEQHRLGPLVLHDWRPYGGLDLVGNRCLVTLRVGGGLDIRWLRQSRAQTADMRAATEAALQLPLMPKDRQLAG